MTQFVPSSDAMESLGESLAPQWASGDIVFLHGDLGAGKTTFVRGVLRGLGWTAGVRSPTFPILQLYETVPPVLHADLYRVKSAHGLGLEDLLDTHLCFVEWPDRLGDLVDAGAVWHVRIDFEGEGRRVTVTGPTTNQP